MNHKALYRTALIASIISTLGWVAYIVGSTGGGASTAGITNAAEFLAIQESNFLGAKIYGWGGLIGVIFTFPYFLGFYQGTEKAGSVRLVPAMTAMIGTTLTAIGFLGSTLAAVYFLVPIAQALPAEVQAHVIAAITMAVKTVEPAWFIGSLMLYGVAPVWVSLHGLRYSDAPKWLNYAGVIGGLAGVTWLANFLPFLEPVATILIMVNILAITVWAIGFSAHLARNG